MGGVLSAPTGDLELALALKILAAKFDHERGTTEVPPAPARRHAESNPDEQSRKEMMQCQSCFKSRADKNITLFRCAGCRIEWYCSRQCQRRAWPVHKIKCQTNQKLCGGAEHAGQHGPRTSKALREFTAKHRPTLSEAGSNCLAWPDPSVAEDNVLLILLRPRPGATRAETSFFALGAEIVPFDFLGEERASELRRMRKLSKHPDYPALFNIVLMSVDDHVSNTTATVFDDTPPGIVRADWKEWMLRRINEGMVV